jgi:symplekin
MEKATAEEKRRKAALADNRKRPSNSNDLPDSKRIKLESGTPSQNNSAALLSTFDFTSLPAPLITNLVVANLEAFSEAQLIAFVNAYRQSRGMHVPIAQPSAAMPMLASTVTNSIPHESPSDISLDFAQTSGEAKEEKEEVIDPLQMDIDEEEMEYEPEKLNKEVCSIAANQKTEISGICIACWCTRRRRRYNGNRSTS